MKRKMNAMMRVSILLFGFQALLIRNIVVAQIPAEKAYKWGFETELVQPFIPTVHIARVQATYTLSAPEKRRGDLIMGAYIRPNVKHDVVEKISEYMASIGYRQYLWKGFNLEGKSNMGYAWGKKNLLDGKDYNTPTWFWESNIGYKFDFLKKQNFSYYAIAQFGALGNIVADIGPRGGKPDTFLQGSLLAGINF
jgi:hypothetical protein